MKRFKFLDNPPGASLGNSVEEFLQRQAAPTCIFLEGEDKTRCRALVTLLHGNEPSGVKALFHWLQSGQRPAVNIICLLPSIEAALAEPFFSHRMLPGMRDLNRCFRAPFDDSQGELAAETLDILNQYQPEAIVDIHNTSGTGPSFGVAISVDEKHEALVSLFTHRIVTNDLRLGAIMEIAEHLFPIVTIECGGRLDEKAHELAWQGLQRFMLNNDVLAKNEGSAALEVFHNPVRLELAKDCDLNYADSPQAGYDLTLKTDIEDYNFGVVNKGTHLGWVGDKELSVFSKKNLNQKFTLEELVNTRDGALYTSQDLKLFMVTSNPEIAKTDCLFYAAKTY